MAELDPWYVTGFCDGEAAFTYSRGSGSFGIYFSVKQREDNKQIVEDLRAYFECVGNLYYNKEAGPTRNSGFTRASAVYRVTRIDELLEIIAHFDKYPLQSKKKLEAYQVWRQMVMHKAGNFRSTNYDILRDLASKLSNLNSKSRAFKVHTR